MSSQDAQANRIKPLASLFFKCTFMVAICVLAVVSVIEFRSQSHVAAKTREVISHRALEVTELLALQMGGSIKFENTQALEIIATAVVETAGVDVIGTVVFDAESAALYATEGEAMQANLAGARALAQAAISTKKSEMSPNGMMVAFPVSFGVADDVVGAVISVWTPEFALEALAKDQARTMIIAFGVFLVALISAAFYLRTQLSRPMVTLESAMKRVATEDYDAEIPYTQRRDEIGQMARRLDQFRATLALAKEAQVETVFKGAAYEGTSAPMMLVDEKFNVVFANAASVNLLSTIEEDLAALWPEFTLENLIGSPLSDLSLVRSALNDVFEGRKSNERLLLRVGEKMIRVAVNPAKNASGVFVGCVVEWADRTITQQNSALIDAINAGQLSIEFDRDGAVLNANQNFLDMIKGTVADTGACNFYKMFANNLDGDPKGMKFTKGVYDQKITQGRFSAYSVHADTSFTLEGNFAVVVEQGKPADRVIFIGRNVTEQDRSEKHVEAERQRNSEEQGHVVGLLGSALNALSDGDLQTTISEEVPASYAKLSADFNETVGSLHDAISLVAHNSENIRNETSEITSAADDLSRRTEKQAATLEETAAALDELTISVRSAAEGADDASKLSAEAQRNAQQGGEVAKQAVSAMDGIKNSSEEISKITSVIDDIAFQTNLLALNAGVEAARAGEAGRGFAVVATEVRALAQRSSDAAREINALISSSGDQVSQGVDLVDRTGEALASIVTSVSDISARVASIATSAREQASGLAEINTAVNDLDQVTQQNAAMFEETTAASHSLTSEADSLANAVARFKLNNNKPAQTKPLASQTSTSAAPTTRAASTPVLSTDGNTALKVSSNAPPETDGWEEF